MATFEQLTTAANDDTFNLRVRHTMAIVAAKIYQEPDASPPAIVDFAKGVPAGTDMRAAAQEIVDKAAVAAAVVAKRKALAKAVIAGSYNVVAAAQAIVTDGTIMAKLSMVPTPGANIDDTDLQASAEAMWNAMAGV